MITSRTATTIAAAAPMMIGRKSAGDDVDGFPAPAESVVLSKAERRNNCHESIA